MRIKSQEPRVKKWLQHKKKSIKNKRLRRIIDEFDFVKNNFKNAGTRHTAFIINKLRAASNFGNI